MGHATAGRARETDVAEAGVGGARRRRGADICNAGLAQRKLDAAIDAIREKYGEDAIKRTSFLNSQYSHMSKGLNQAKRKKQDKM